MTGYIPRIREPLISQTEPQVWLNELDDRMVILNEDWVGGPMLPEETAWRLLGDEIEHVDLRHEIARGLDQDAQYFGSYDAAYVSMVAENDRRAGFHARIAAIPTE